jgi:hypothetical protein
MLMAHSGPLGQESQELIGLLVSLRSVAGGQQGQRSSPYQAGAQEAQQDTPSQAAAQEAPTAAQPLTGRASGSAHPLAVCAPDQLGQGPNQPGGAQSSPAPSRRQPRGRGGTPASCLPASQASFGSSLHQNQLMRRSRRVRYSRPSLPCPKRMPGLVGSPAFH